MSAVAVAEGFPYNWYESPVYDVAIAVPAKAWSAGLRVSALPHLKTVPALLMMFTLPWAKAPTATDVIARINRTFFMI